MTWVERIVATTILFQLGEILGLLGAGRGPLRPPSQALTLNSQNPK